MERLAQNRRLLALGIFACTCLAFLPTLRNGFVQFDDAYYVTNNVTVLRGLTWHGVYWAFTTFEISNWHPLAWLSHMLDVQLFGTRGWGHHLTSLLLHGGVATLVFLFLEDLTADPLRSAAAAMLFAVHPLRVESVAWTAERKDLLCALFYLLACRAHVRRVRSNGNGTKVALFTFLALLSKPMAVSLPGALLLLDVWPLRRKESPLRLVVEKLPLVVLVAGSSVITVLAQLASNSIAKTLPLLTRLATAAVNPARYLRLTLWPRDLVPLYPLDLHPPAWVVAASVALLVAITVVAVLLRKQRPQVAWGWAWFLITLFPVSGVVQAGIQSVADRYMYLPHIGLFTAMVWLVPDFSRRAEAVLAGALALALVVLGGLSFQQTKRWKDATTLFTYTLEHSPDNPVANQVIGVELMRKKMFKEAEPYFRASLKRYPVSPGTWVDLGNVLIGQRRYDEALEAYQKARRYGVGDLDVADAYAGALVHLKHYGEALEQYRFIEKFEPNYPRLPLKMGIVLGQVGGHDEEALAHLERAVRDEPQNALAHASLGVALARGSRFDAAIAEFQRALELNPQQEGVEAALRNAREDSGKQHARIASP